MDVVTVLIWAGCGFTAVAIVFSVSVLIGRTWGIISSIGDER